MFERFTDRARRVLVYAQEETRNRHDASMGTEHILIGLLLEAEGVAAQTLGDVGVTVDKVREKLTELRGANDADPSSSPPFTSRSKKVLEYSLREALEMGHSYIGTEHLLCGIVREGEGVAAKILESLDVEMAQLRRLVFEKAPGQSGANVDDLHDQMSIDGASFLRVVRSVGEQLRPDFDGAHLGERSAKIASELFAQLREAWMEPDITS